MIYGWDISTSIIGLCKFSDDGRPFEYGYLDLRKIDGQLSKADAFFKWSNRFLNNSEQNFHFIEERLGGFAAGRTSAQVMMKLAQFNAICSYIIWTGGGSNHRQVSYLHPSSWKSLMKKEGLLIPKGSDKKEVTLAFVRRKQLDFDEFVKKYLNKNGNVHPWCYDVADAYCIGKAGYLKSCIEKGSSQLSEGP